MKTRKKIILALMLPLLPIINVAKVFADNDYGINYSGGAPLSTDNVIIDPSISELRMLTPGGTAKFSDSDKWESAYMASNQNPGLCRKYRFIRFSDNNRITPSDDISYTIETPQYDMKIQITKLSKEGSVSPLDAGVIEEPSGAISLNAGQGDYLYTDSNCTNKLNGLSSLSIADDSKLFIEANIKLFKHGTNETFTSNELYFGLTDIDAAQSYKLLNAPLQGNMYAKSTSELEIVDSTLRNMYVESGNYIYSEYTSSSMILSNLTNNIYVKIANADVKQNGLDIIFGFAGGAGSGVMYYAKFYQVNYESDGHGVVSGIKNEDVASGDNPSGSKSTPNEEYAFKHWVADKDVTLENGTTITAGKPIKEAQVKQVVVTEDLTFTAIHETIEYKVNYESDEHGIISGIENEDVASKGNPSGSESTPNDEYAFEHWIADKDVTLEDGTEIKAGEPITEAQVKQVVVTEDLTFTAIHEKIIVVPDTGHISNDDAGVQQIAMPVAGFIIIATLSSLFPILTHKKIGFNRK